MTSCVYGFGNVVVGQETLLSTNSCWDMVYLYFDIGSTCCN